MTMFVSKVRWLGFEQWRREEEEEVRFLGFKENNGGGGGGGGDKVFKIRNVIS